MSIWTRIAETISAIGDSIGGFLQQIASRTATPPEKSIAFTIGMIGKGRNHQQCLTRQRHRIINRERRWIEGYFHDAGSGRGGAGRIARIRPP